MTARRPAVARRAAAGATFYNQPFWGGDTPNTGTRTSTAPDMAGWPATPMSGRMDPALPPSPIASSYGTEHSGQFNERRSHERRDGSCRLTSDAMSRVMMWLITAALLFIAWLFGPFSPLPFVSLLPLLLTSLAITSGRAAGWGAGSVVLAVLVWGWRTLACTNCLVLSWQLSLRCARCFMPSFHRLTVRSSGLP